MRHSFVFAAASVLAAGACTAAPQPAASPQPAQLEAAQAIGPMEPPPVHALIGHRQALGLSSEQITALDSIGQQLNAENQALMRTVAEYRNQVRSRTGRDARPGDALSAPEEVRTAANQIRLNNRAATVAVRQLLTTEQEARTCQLFRETDERRQGGVSTLADRRATPAERRRRAAERSPMVPPTWAWCAEQPGASATATSEG